MSERIVEFALRVAESDLVDIDCLPEPTDVVCRRSGGPTFYEWELRESDWSRIATLRAALPEDASLWSEDATLQRVLPQNLSAATLIKLSPPQEERLRLSNGAIRARCSTCGHGSWQLGPDGVPPVLHGPLNDRGVFLPKGSSCLILHDDVLHSLRKAGLDKGIHATPVTWDGCQEFVWVRGTQPLGHALRPFGSTHPPCSECGWAKPLYGFYPTFEIGARSGWMWSDWGGPVRAIVSNDVYRFLDGKWGLKPGELGGYILGDISEIDQAFLPAEYRRPEHAIPWSEEER